MLSLNSGCKSQVGRQIYTAGYPDHQQVFQVRVTGFGFEKIL